LNRRGRTPAERIAQRLFDQVTNTTVSKPRRGAATWAASAIAALGIWLILMESGSGLTDDQERLLAQTTQRAEYYADQLAERAAGSRAAMSALGTTRFAEACLRELQTSVIRRAPDIWVATRPLLRSATEDIRASAIG
jgi:hypothetical protein